MALAGGAKPAPSTPYVGETMFVLGSDLLSIPLYGQQGGK